MANIKTIKEMLMNATFEVFERVFFIFAEPMTESNADYRISANISFDGPMKGDMQITMTDNLAKIMAVNMLNIDDGHVTDTVIADCVKECLNMICGSFVRKVDPNHVFDLAIPKLKLVSKRTLAMDSQNGSLLNLVFDTEGGPFEIAMNTSGCL